MHKCLSLSDLCLHSCFESGSYPSIHFYQTEWSLYLDSRVVLTRMKPEDRMWPAVCQWRLDQLFCVVVHKHPAQTTKGEGIFPLTHSFRGHGPWWLCPNITAARAYDRKCVSPCGRQEAERRKIPEVTRTSRAPWDMSPVEGRYRKRLGPIELPGICPQWHPASYVYHLLIMP